MAGVKAVRVTSILDESVPPGGYELHTDGMFFRCPCGCGAIGFLSFTQLAVNRPNWVFDGNEDSPTVTPEINLGHWAGVLSRGVWVQIYGLV